jgi:hypothetical protein
MNALKTSPDHIARPGASGRLPAALFGVLFLVFALAAQPDVLMSLGVMTRTLGSADPNIRHFTLLELTLVRWTCLALTALSFGLCIHLGTASGRERLRRFIDSSPQVVLDRRLLNLSFAVLVSCVAAYLCYVALGVTFLSMDALKRINVEDGLIEQATALFFALNAILAAILAIRPGRLPRRRLVFALLAAGMVILAGEEISWGQRIFGVESNEFFKTYNVQSETNLHNLLGYAADHFFILGIFLYFCILPLLTAGFPSWRAFVGHLGLPVASFGLAFGMLLVSLIHDATTYRFLAHVPFLRNAEPRELFTALGFSLLFLEALRERRWNAGNGST